MKKEEAKQFEELFQYFMVKVQQYKFLGNLLSNDFSKDELVKILSEVKFAVIYFAARYGQIFIK